MRMAGIKHTLGTANRDDNQVCENHFVAWPVDLKSLIEIQMKT